MENQQNALNNVNVAAFNNMNNAIQQRLICNNLARKPDMFSGRHTQSVRTFLLRMHNFLACNGGNALPESLRVHALVACLEHEAFEWYEDWLQQRNFDFDAITYNDLAEALRARFTKQNAASLARDKLLMLRQDRISVQEYTSRFNRISLEITNMSEDDKLHQYVHGLKESIKNQVEHLRCIDLQFTLQKAIALAERIDSIQYNTRKMKAFTHSNDSQPSSEPMDIDAGAMHAMKMHRKKLTNNEWERRKTSRLCFNCGKSGHFSRECSEGKDSEEH